MDKIKKLDNPVWYSLSESHQCFAVSHTPIKFYHPDYCPFGGFTETGNISKACDDYARHLNDFFIVGEKPPVSNLLQIKEELVCLQMVQVAKINIANTENIVELGPEDTVELLRLVNVVQPGYFKKKTADLGRYYGIFKNNDLLAVTGERMKMNNYVEVSAVITHPEHQGKGYAKQLVAFAVNKILSDNKIPYLHVAETNSKAINLYERLGFETRRKISFWQITNHI